MRSLLLFAFTLAGCTLNQAADSNVGLFHGPGGRFIAEYEVRGEFAVVGGDQFFELSAVTPVDDNELLFAGYAYEEPDFRGTVTYVLRGFEPQNHDPIIRAIEAWNRVADTTGVRFVPSVSGEFGDLRIRSHRDLSPAVRRSVASDLGTYFHAFQEITLNEELMGTGGIGLQTVAAHEIGHALGLQHEEVRPDRDQAIEILWDNVREGAGDRFAKMEMQVPEGTPYDYASVMHIVPWSGSTDVDGRLPTIRFLNQVPPGVQVGRMGGPSPLDAAAVAHARTLPPL